MFEVPLHGGIDHPELLWILVASIVSFVTGIAIGSYTGAFDRLGSGTRD